MAIKIKQNNKWVDVSGVPELDSLQKKLTAGANIVINETDPNHPVISATGGGEPSQYLKTIAKDEINKKITITDKAGTATEFPYSEGSEPAEYLKKAEVSSTGDTLTIYDKEGYEIKFTPTVSGGVTKDYVDTQDQAIRANLEIVKDEVKQTKGEMQLYTDNAVAPKLNSYGKVPGTTEDYHVPYNIANLRYDNSDHKLKGTLETVTLNNAQTKTQYPLEVELPNIENKLDIVQNESGVYTQQDDGETRETVIVPYSDAVDAGFIVARAGNGEIKVRTTPTENDEAVAKLYVDNKFLTSTNIDNTTIKFDDTNKKLYANLPSVWNLLGVFETISELPTTANNGDVYLVGASTASTRDMYIWISNLTTTNKWVKIGSSGIDLSAYETSAHASSTYATKTALSTTDGNLANLTGTVTDHGKRLTSVEAKANSAYNGLTNGSVTKVGTATKGNALQGIYLNGGTPTAGTQLYNRTIGINGTSWNVIRPNNSDVGNIYAPTSAGNNGQVLRSSGGTPSWQNSGLSIGYLYTGAQVAKGNITLTESYKNYTFIMFECINNNGERSNHFFYTPWFTAGQDYCLTNSTADTNRWSRISPTNNITLAVEDNRQLDIKWIIGIR